MSETKFTPGPWVAEQPQPHRLAKWGIYCNDVTGSIVAELGGFIYAPRSPDVDAANARLIAAAPDGYALAEEIINHLYLKHDIARVRQMAKDFIAKAVKP